MKGAGKHQRCGDLFLGLLVSNRFYEYLPQQQPKQFSEFANDFRRAVKSRRTPLVRTRKIAEMQLWHLCKNSMPASPSGSFREAVRDSDRESHADTESAQSPCCFSLRSRLDLSEHAPVARLRSPAERENRENSKGKGDHLTLPLRIGKSRSFLRNRQAVFKANAYCSDLAKAVEEPDAEEAVPVEKVETDIGLLAQSTSLAHRLTDFFDKGLSMGIFHPAIGHHVDL